MSNVAVVLALVFWFGACAGNVPTPSSDGRASSPGGDGARSSDGAAPSSDGAALSENGDQRPDEGPAPGPSTSRIWIHRAPTSALIYWWVGAIDRSARTLVEYGETSNYGKKTPTTPEPRLAQLHRLTGLSPATTYHFRMVMILADGTEARSADQTLPAQELPGAIPVPGNLPGPPYQLAQDKATYLLTQDVSAGGTAIEVTGSDVTLELDGRTVTYGTSSSAQVHGVLVKGGGLAVVRNGHVVQGQAAGRYSSGVESRLRSAPIEISGITTEVHRPNGYPLRLFGDARDARIHHNHLRSVVTEIASRHYPGNSLLLVNASGPNVTIVDNLLTEGVHRGIEVSGTGTSVEVAYNDIRHHSRYVNGYAIACSAPGMNVHHNRVTSTGLGAHFKKPDIDFHDNHFDLKGHMMLSDEPQGSRPFKEMHVELHGIKIEGESVTGTRIHGNHVRIVQPLPDGTWDYVPSTPLNLSSYGRDAMNEVFGNTFIALTEYFETSHGGYGASGKWASPIYLVAMTKGASSAGKYTVYVHDNQFVSNDLFVSATTSGVDMTVRVEKNTFTLATTPKPTKTHAPFRQLGAALESAIKAGGNTFIGMAP